MDKLTLMSRTVDKGTVYERVVYTDPTTLTGQQEMLENLIAEFVQKRGVRHTGKTAKHVGYQARRAARRSVHEAWMNDIKRDPSKPFPHPLHIEAA